MADKTNDNIPTDVYKVGTPGKLAQITWDLKIRNGYEVVVYHSKSDPKGYTELLRCDANKRSVFVNGEGETFFRVSTVRKIDGVESQKSSQFCFVEFTK